MSEYEYSYSSEDDQEDEFEIKFVSKNQRTNFRAPNTDSESEEEDEIDRKKRRKESKRLANEAMKNEVSSDQEEIEPLSEPPAPDSSDAKANAELQYTLWVEREIQRLRDEVMVEAKVALDQARNRRQQKMTDRELAIIKEKHEREKKANRGRMKFMQKYFHRGVFSANVNLEKNPEAQKLLQRDYTTAVGEDLYDKTIMPSDMLVRGDDYKKKGRSKWTHLANEDSTTKEMREEAKRQNAKNHNPDKMEPIPSVHRKKRDQS